MKPEPLKDKCIVVGIDDLDDYLDDYLDDLRKELKAFKYPQLHHFELYHGQYIKSAVEWLKNIIVKEIKVAEKYNTPQSFNASVLLRGILISIDKAFEDVTDKPPKKSE